MDVDELYGLPSDRFVPERNALARELRSGGQRDEAAVVAALRKPSVAARAINRLAREHARQLRELFKVGDALTKTQSRVLAGTADGRALGEAADRERAIVSSLVDTARELLASEAQQPSATVLERVGETLHAAALDGEARERVQQGRLERELRHVGLGMGAGDAVATDTAPAPAPAKAAQRGEARAARRRAAARQAAEAAEADARRQAERAAKALGVAERDRSRAAEALERAEAALRAARDEAQAADAARSRLQQELDSLPDA